MKKRFPIHRTRIGKDIVAEFVVPTTKTAIKRSNVAILAQGMPSSPGKASLITFLVKQGFYVIHPRYRGTWESGGSFLKNEPTKDILDVISWIMTKPLVSVWTNETFMFPKHPNIYIFASSFGGAAGALLTGNANVTGVIALSPVVDWSADSKEEPLGEMFGFVTRAYGEAYRMERKDWNKLGKTDFYDPLKQIKKVDGSKLLIFHAKDDGIVPFSSVAVFVHKTGTQLISYKKGGHFGLDELQDPKKWLKVKTFIKK